MARIDPSMPMTAASDLALDVAWDIVLIAQMLTAAGLRVPDSLMPLAVMFHDFGRDLVQPAHIMETPT